ncbi:MAG TPA: hypothetical protein DEU03_06275 [Bacillus sp. (in: Bacteria)]|uniref:Transposase n=1 Tax=Bacillus thuringiensis TaxID=1428 RepID=A0AAW4HZ82_BACTU|nr:MULTISPECIES: zinc ribbon domain-containing protein [Bacillus cereus group]KAB7651069.1 transposase [Bacillus sp. B2-WWTP-C-10-Post-4]HCF52766.1 hypothetical protein [Bacillus sp. (in: firmicutes)]EKS7870133.1 transposase [Bacillus cereus]MBN9901215.1 transposase [Bacillus thuringiensis]MDY0952482.1 zinc ribbon domain-containing protein [Bacillus thuringiensis]
MLKVPLLFLVDEAYTSQTCPCCQRRKCGHVTTFVCAATKNTGTFTVPATFW